MNDHVKLALIIVVAIALVAWCIYFFTHQEELCRSWWFATEDWCIRYNTTHPR